MHSFTHNRPFFLIILILLLLPLVPAGVRADAIGSISVVMDDNYPPYVFKDEQGNLKGILVDQWQLWERKTGIRAEVHAMGWAEAQKRMEAGEFDVIDTIFRNERRAAIYDFTRPYATIPVPLFFSEDLSGIRGPADLQGFVVAAKAGDNAIDILRKNGITSIAEYPSYEKIIEAARNGKVKVFAVDRPAALYYLNKMGIQGKFRETKPMYSGEFHRAVLRGNPRLLGVVEDGFSRILPEEYRSIDKIWMGTPLPSSPLLRYAGYLSAAGLAVFLMLTVWLRMLKKAVSRKTGELAASEERYRSLVDHLPLGVSLISRDHRIQMTNSTLARMFSHSPEWFIGRHCYQAYEKREEICAHCPGTISMATGGPSCVETEGIRDDGSRFTVRIHTVPLKEADGTPAGFIEVVEDITESVQARENLEREQVRLRTLLQTIPDLVWLKDPDGVYLACNARFERFFGAREKDITGKTDYQFLSKEQADTFRTNDRRAIEANSPIISVECVTYADDGHMELQETIRTPVKDTHGALTGVLGVARDITAMRKAEEALRESELRYRHLVELAPYAIYVHQQERLVFVNPAGCRLLGAEEPGQLIGRQLLEMVHPDYHEAVTACMESAQSADAEVPPLEEVLVRLDGSLVTVEVVAKALTFQGEPAVQVLANDISERRLLEQEQVRSQKLESLGVLAGGIAHDFNNILTGVLGNISFARILIGDEHRAAGRLKEAEKAAEHAGELTRQLLTFSRGGAPVLMALDTASLLEESLSFALRGSNVKGVLDCPPEILKLDADQGQMRQVLNNLLINAKQAMPRGGIITLSAANHIVAEGDPCQLEPGAYVRIDVKDQGEGITEAIRARIFDPYFTTKAQGSGLGLASVYSIIKQHQGTITVKSSPGNGATFTLLIPAAKVQATGETMLSAAGPLPVGQGRVLVMDDEAMIRDLAVEMLEELGYTCQACQDGGEAIALHLASLESDEPFAAIILDLTVPGGIGGKEAAACIRQHDPTVPLIVSSGYSGDDVIAGYRRFGFSGAVTKPYTMRAMAAELSRILTAGQE